MQVDIPLLNRPANLQPFDSRIEVQPTARDSFQAMGLISPSAFLNLSGEIVSGHPDRHVMRVELPDGRVCFLKKQHRVRWQERLKNWRAGFGWSSKSVREGRILKEITRRNIATPNWLAFGECDNRAFLLVEAISHVDDLRRLAHTQKIDHELAKHLGQFCAELHNAGADHPDLCAKHLLIDRNTHDITLLDWQRASIGRPVSWQQRINALAALAATTPECVSSRLCGRFLWAYRRIARAHSAFCPSFAHLTRAISGKAQRLERRRGIREQRQPPLTAKAQRLVWLDGEALCALPEVADDLRSPSARTALYDESRNGSEWCLSTRPKAKLQVRSYPSWFHGRSWRAPEVRLARLLFHLERFHLEAPKLLAYGQRRNRNRIEAFILFEHHLNASTGLGASLREASSFRSERLQENLVNVMNRLHEAGCAARTIDTFVVVERDNGPLIRIFDPRRLDFRRQLTARQKIADWRRVIRSMQPYCDIDAIKRFAQMQETRTHR